MCKKIQVRQNQKEDRDSSFDYFFRHVCVCGHEQCEHTFDITDSSNEKCNIDGCNCKAFLLWVRIQIPQNIIKDLDYLFYVLGINIIPVKSRKKIPGLKWPKYQNYLISKEQYTTWKERGDFDQGVVIRAGRIWRGLNQWKYLVCVNINNEKGIEEFLSLGLVEPCDTVYQEVGY